jgi:cold shock CspA family protein
MESEPIQTNTTYQDALRNTPSHDETAEDIGEPLPVLQEISDNNVIGKYVGQTKWFNISRGYGFISIVKGSDKGKDVFVHHTGIKPLTSHYRTLYKGEYVQFDITNSPNGNMQAVNVTGIDGNCLMCDVVPPPRYGPRFNGIRNTSISISSDTRY